MALIAHYRLDGDATDSVGDNHGTATGVTWVDGKLGGAGSFNGLDSVVDTGIRIENFIKDMSISGWITSPDLSERNPLVEVDTSGVKPQVSVDGIEGSVNVMFHNEGHDYYHSFSAFDYIAAQPVDAIFHICSVKKGEVPFLYVNGIEYSLTRIGSGAKYKSNKTLTIGKGYRAGATRHASAVIDDVRIYDHALSQREVRDLSLGQISSYPLKGDLLDSVGTGFIEAGPFVDSTIGTVSDVRGSQATVPMSAAPLSLSGETIVFWQKCERPRDEVQTSSFSHWFVHWGSYHADNSGGIGIYRGSPRYYLRGPGASGWTDNGSPSSEAADIYDKGEFVHHAVVFTEDGRFKVYMNAIKVVDIALSVPYTGIEQSVGTRFGRGLEALMGEIKFISTALTDDQVKELYHQRASIDSQGSVHSVSLDENPRIVATRPTSKVGEPYQVLPFEEGEEYGIDHYLTSVVNSDTSIWYEYQFFVEESGDYAIRCFLLTPDGTRDSFFMSLDGESFVTWHTGQSTSWWWRTWATRNLSRGWHSLRVAPREDYSSIALIEIESGENRVIPGHPSAPNSRGVNGSFSEVGPARGLVAWYPLIGDTLDYAGTNHAVNNGAVATAEGYEFDGESSQLATPPENSLNGLQQITLSAWCYANSNGWSRVLVRGDHSQWQLDFSSDGRYRFYASDTDTYDSHHSVTSDYSGLTEVWHHVVGVFDGSKMSIHIDGAEQSSKQTLTGFSDMPNKPLYIGNDSRENDVNHFDGAIRDVRIYDRALSPEEVAMLHNMTRPGGSKTAFAQNCLYTRGQIKEVIS